MNFAKRPYLLLVLVIVLDLSLVVGRALSESSPDNIGAGEFVQRRDLLRQSMADASLAIFSSGEEKVRSNDVTFEFRQNNDFYYLTGITDPRVLLVVFKEPVEIEGERASDILFIPKTHPHMQTVLGATISADRAKSESGFEVVRTLDSFKALLPGFLEGKSILYYDFEPSFVSDPVSDSRFFLGRHIKKALTEAHPDLQFKSPIRLVAQLRQIKSEAEIGLLRKAIDITCKAQIEAMRSAAPGMHEFQLEAVIEYVFKYSGAEYPAFPSIIGSGPNSTILHHWKNRRQLEDGDLVVMDIGAEYRGYSADVTRTIPVNGKFTAKQREIYEIVLRAQNKAIESIKPGVLFGEVHTVARQVIEEAGYGPYFIHSTSHYLGLDTHDVGARNAALQQGMVLTVEPGIYIREGAELDPGYWNIGVRIEDDVLVTESGYELLSESAPRQIDEIESVMLEQSKLTLFFR